MTKAQLTGILDKAGVKYPKTAKKSDLEYLVNTMKEVEQEVADLAEKNAKEAIDENPEATQEEIQEIVREKGQPKLREIMQDAHAKIYSFFNSKGVKKKEAEMTEEEVKEYEEKTGYKAK